MNPNHISLVEKHKELFIRTVDTDRIVPVLQSKNVLTQSDVLEIDRQLSREHCIEKLLEILLTRENSFHALCVTLEQTYPQILTAMFLDNTDDARYSTRLPTEASYNSSNLPPSEKDSENWGGYGNGDYYLTDVTVASVPPALPKSLPPTTPPVPLTPFPPNQKTAQTAMSYDSTGNGNDVYPYNSINTDTGVNQTSSANNIAGSGPIRRDVKPEVSVAEKRALSEAPSLRRDQVGRSSSHRRSDRRRDLAEHRNEREESDGFTSSHGQRENLHRSNSCRQSELALQSSEGNRYSGISRDQPIRRSDRHPGSTHVTVADLDSRYAVLRERNSSSSAGSSAGSRRGLLPDEKQEVLVYYPVQLKRGDSDRSSGRSSTISRDASISGAAGVVNTTTTGTTTAGKSNTSATTPTTTRGSIHSLKEEPPGFQFKRDDSKRQSGGRQTLNDAPPFYRAVDHKVETTTELFVHHPTEVTKHTGWNAGAAKWSSARDNTVETSTYQWTPVSEVAGKVGDGEGTAGVKASGGATHIDGLPASTDSGSNVDYGQCDADVHHSSVTPLHTHANAAKQQLQDNKPRAVITKEERELIDNMTAKGVRSVRQTLQNKPPDQRHKAKPPSRHVHHDYKQGVDHTLPRHHHRKSDPNEQNQTSSQSSDAYDSSNITSPAATRTANTSVPYTMPSIPAHVSTIAPLPTAPPTPLPAATMSTTPLSAAQATSVTIPIARHASSSQQHPPSDIKSIGLPTPTTAQDDRIRQVETNKPVMRLPVQKSSDAIHLSITAKEKPPGDHQPSSQGEQYSWLQAQHELQTLKQQYSEALKQCESVKRESDMYRRKYSLLKEKVSEMSMESLSLKDEKNELLEERSTLQQQVEDIHRLREHDKQQIAQLRQQHQEVIKENGSSDMLNQLYNSTLEKYESVKEERDSVKDEQNELVVKLNFTKTKLELVNKENARLRDTSKELSQHLNVAKQEKMRLQEQCTAVIHNWNDALKHKDTIEKDYNRLKKEHHDFKREHVKAAKDIERLRLERNSMLYEYHMIMSERDNVHKEIEGLQDKQFDTEKQLKQVEEERLRLNQEVTNLKHELGSALQERDKAANQYQQLQQQNSNTTEHQEATSAKSANSRTDRNSNRFSDSQSSDLDAESLKRNIEKLQVELNDAIQESEVCKHHRDWAFSERDKIVLERESIRTLCDKLRRERDRAVSDLAEALRDIDELKRQKVEANKQLKDTKEKYEALAAEQGGRTNTTYSVTGGSSASANSCDSAIDTDLHPHSGTYWEAETLTVNIPHGNNSEDFGFELSTGGSGTEQSTNNQNNLYVSHVNVGSAADGKLKIHDQVLVINNIPVSSHNYVAALQAERGRNTHLTMVVRRMKLVNSPLIIQLSRSDSKQDFGLELEAGAFISRITPGSIADHHHKLVEGDRIVMINNQLVEDQCLSNLPGLLASAGDHITLSVQKTAPSRLSTRSKSVGGGSGGNFSSYGFNRSTAHSSGEGHSSSHQLDSGMLEMFSKSIGSPFSPVDYEQLFNRKQSIESTSSTDRHQAKRPVSQLMQYGRSPSADYDEARSTTRTDHSDYSGTGKKPRRYPNGKPSSGEAGKRSRKKTSSEYAGKNGGTWPKQVPRVPNILSFNDNDEDEFVLIPTLTKMRPPLTSETFAVPHSTSNNKEEQSHNAKYNTRHARHIITNPSVEGKGGVGGVSDNNSGEGVPLYAAAASPPLHINSKSSPSTPPLLHHGFSTTPASTMSKTSGDFTTCDNENLITSSKSAYSYRKPAHSSSNKSRLSYSGQPHVPGQRFAPNSLDLHMPYSPRPLPHPGLIVPYQSGSVGSDDCHITSEANRTSPFQSTVSPTVQQASLPAATTPREGGRHSGSTSSSSHYHDSLSQDRIPSLSSSPSTVSSPRYSSPPGYSSVLPPHSSTSPGMDVTAQQHPAFYSPSPSPSQLSGSCEEEMFRGTLSVSGGGGGGGGVVNSSQPHSRRASNRSQISATSEIYYNPTGRIRIPSNNSVLSSRGRLSTNSSVDGGSSSTGILRRTPNHGETRTIYVEKSSGQLGITIQRGLSGGIYVASVSDNSVAEMHGMEVGDQLLEVCGINMRNATFETAASILRQMGDSITMLVQYKPDKMRSGELSPADHSSSALSSDDDIDNNDDDQDDVDDDDDGDSMSTSSNTPRFTRFDSKRNRQSSRTITPESQNISPIHRSSGHDHKDVHVSGSHSSKDRGVASGGTVGSANSGARVGGTTDNTRHGHQTFGTEASVGEPRLKIIKKISPDDSLGINFIGGNALGIYIQNVQLGSLAHQQKLAEGDQILEFNGVDLRAATTEQATTEISKPSANVSILVQQNKAKYLSIKSLNCDSLYIRALCDYEGKNERELTLKKHHVYHVDNTLYTSIGTWRAWALAESGDTVTCGAIPSKAKMEEMLSRHSLSDMNDEEVKSSRRSSGGSAGMRRSFFRRKKHHRNNSKDSRELTSYTDVSTMGDSTSLLYEGSCLAYQRVERLDTSVCRPVLLIAPLAEALIDKLSSESPDKYSRCQKDAVRASASSLEAHQDKGIVIDYKQNEQQYHFTHVNAVKEIIKLNRHCMMSYHPCVVEQLHKVEIYPIVLLVKHRNAKEIRDVRDSRFCPEKMTNKLAKELYENCKKHEQDYKAIICESIPGGDSLAYMTTKIKAAIDNQQKQTVWIPSGQL